MKKYYFGKIQLIKPELFIHLDAGNLSSYSGTGSIWYDLTTNGNNATLYNSPAYDSANSGSLTFNGVNSFAEILFKKRSLNFTYNIWVNLQVRKIGGAFISSGSGSIFNFIQVGNGTMPIQFGNAISGSASNIAQWEMFTATQNGSVQKLYRNGVLVATGSGFSRFFSKLVIGKRIDDIYLNTKISSVKVYGRVLTDAEITAEFNDLKSRYGL